MDYRNDRRTVLTLDAGGTNFIFSAMRENKTVVDPVRREAHGDNLERCLLSMVEGFREVLKNLPEEPVAISFAFPGPADYPAGVIGDLVNLPAFRGGVPLGPFLEEEFGLPVFINNDGDLFTLGEAISGFLPFVNSLLEEAGSPKRYGNLFGITLGTGFGGGLVHRGRLYIGDNSAAGEIWILRNLLLPHSYAEEGVSIRAVKRVYAEESGDDNPPDPKAIRDIALEQAPGDAKAARLAFQRLGKTVGDALATVMTILDGLIVVGGGLSGAYPLIVPALLEEMNGYLKTLAGQQMNRLVAKVYDLEEPGSLERFLVGQAKDVAVPGKNRMIRYDPHKRIGIGLSRLGTSEAVSVGAYAFALEALDNI